MTLTRIWPYPDLRNGATLHHISDPHHGAESHVNWLRNWQDRSADDAMDLRVVNNTGHIMTGDTIQMQGFTAPSDRLTEIGWYKTWRSQINADGKPWVECNGNHDMRKADGDAVNGYTSTMWAAHYGVPSVNRAVDMGDLKVLSVGPDVWDIDDPRNPTGSYGLVNVFRLSDATLDWLDAQLRATTKPCFIGAHLCLAEQYASGADDGYSAANFANPRLTDILISNPNAVGWLSGHRHTNIQTKPDHAVVRTLPNSTKKMYMINAPGAAGGTLAGVDDPRHQWESVSQSMYLTYMGDAMDVRWRDHNSRTWTGPGLERTRHLLLK